MKNLIWVFLISSFLTACGKEKSPVLVPPPGPPPQVLTEKSTAPKAIFNPMVDILFVLDDSKSMREELDILRKNMQDFVASFGKNPLIDYHIGAVKVHDSTRYNNQVVKKFNPETKEIHYFEKGELIAPHGTDLSDPSASRFVTRNNSKDLLQSLFEFEAHWQQLDDVKVDKKTGEQTVLTYARGPEIEESFSPVKAALSSPALLGTSNRNFHRAGSHLVVIFVTDAEDSSPDFNPQQLFDFLFKLKGEQIELLSAYGVLCEPGDKPCLNLKQNGVDTIESDAHRIREFIQLVAATKQEKLNVEKRSKEFINPILNLRSNTWGVDLAHIGEEIRRETIEKPIQLSDTPEFDMEKGLPKIKVTIGGKELPYDPVKGWTYRADSNTVVIHEGINFDEYQEGAEVNIEYVKVNSGRNARAIK